MNYKVITLLSNNNTGIMLPMFIDNPVPEVKDTHLHLYIVDTKATIEVGDEIYCKGEFSALYPKGVYIVSGISTVGRYYLTSLDGLSEYCLRDGTEVEGKVIASTDDSLGLPAIPQHLINAIVEYGVDNVTITDTHLTSYGEFLVDWNSVEVLFDTNNQPTEEVDFELLKQIYGMKGDHLDRFDSNLLQFFEQLKNPSFALKASEWLRNC